jgi:catechol 2,3-dioxygenase-like lactoylglutathione lyase family enzyme
MTPALTPELDVESLDRSLAFYTEVLGFTVMFSRPEEKFAYLTLGDAHLMLEEAAGPGRRFTTAPLEHPYGRGVNFQMRVSDVDAIYQRVLTAGSSVPIPLEERWYRANEREKGNRQFVVADPDGYLLRFFTDLGERATDAGSESTVRSG